MVINEFDAIKLNDKYFMKVWNNLNISFFKLI